MDDRLKAEWNKLYRVMMVTANLLGPHLRKQPLPFKPVLPTGFLHIGGYNFIVLFMDAI